MPFVLPTFNLHANIWHFAGGVGNYNAPDLAVMGNLTPGRRVMLGGVQTSTTLGSVVTMEVLLPKLTDIRCNWNAAPQQDTIEIPAGSHRFYRVGYVDDIAKGFANEHRIAWVNMLMQGQTFTDVGHLAAPVPLP